MICFGRLRKRAARSKTSLETGTRGRRLADREWQRASGVHDVAMASAMDEPSSSGPPRAAPRGGIGEREADLLLGALPV